MILGIGNDLIELQRIRQSYGRWGEGFLKKIFTEQEREYALSRKDPVPHLAARFAAKEAAAKALGTGIARGVKWKDVEVRRERGQAPTLHLSGRAMELAVRKGSNVRLHLTLTHSRDLAQAIVIVEGDRDSESP